MRLRSCGIFASAIVPALMLASVARADSWTTGSFTTYEQNDWGDPTNPGGQLLASKYGEVYASVGDIFTVGLPGQGVMLFASSDDLDNYLPSSGTPGVLSGLLVNPLSSSSGVFGGEVAALKLNIDLSAAGLLPSTAGVNFDNLYLTGLTGDFAAFNGMQVSQVLPIANDVLGGASTPHSLDDIIILTAEINNSFESGTPDAFAIANLTATPPSNTVPEPSSLLLLALGLGAVLAMAVRWSKPALFE